MGGTDRGTTMPAGGGDSGRLLSLFAADQSCRGRSVVGARLQELAVENHLSRGRWSLRFRQRELVVPARSREWQISPISVLTRQRDVVKLLPNSQGIRNDVGDTYNGE
jgi:hypothetical protein